MAEKKPVNPFEKFNSRGTVRMQVKALDGAEVEVKKELSIAEEQIIKSIMFANQTNDGTTIIANQADVYAAKLKTVSLILVEPKMSVRDLGELHGADKAIDEIFYQYQEQKAKRQEGN